MREVNSTFYYEGLSSIPSTSVRDPFHFVPPPCESENVMSQSKSKRKNTIQRYLTPPPTSSSNNANVSQVQLTPFHPTLDDH